MESRITSNRRFSNISGAAYFLSPPFYFYYLVPEFCSSRRHLCALAMAKECPREKLFTTSSMQISPYLVAIVMKLDGKEFQPDYYRNANSTHYYRINLTDAKSKKSKKVKIDFTELNSLLNLAAERKRRPQCSIHRKEFFCMPK